MLSSHRVSMVAGVAIVSTAIAFAETDGSDDEPVRYDEIVLVTASAAPTPRNEVPNRSEVVDRAEIEARQAVDLTRLLPLVAGVEIAQSGSPGKAASVFLRGAESDQVLVLWNGIRLNDPFFAGFDWAHLTTQALDRIEVVYGPAGALHGSDAIGGTINLITRRAAGLGAVAEFGTDGYRRASMTAGDRGPQAGFEVSGIHRADDGFADNDDYRLLAGHLDAGWSPSESSALGLLARAADHDLGIPFASGVPSPRRRQRGASYQLAVPWSWTGSAWSAEAHVDGHWTDFEFEDPEAVFSRNDTRAERLGLQALVRRHGRLGGVAFGVESFAEEVDNESNFGVNLAGAERRQRAGFVDAEWLVGERTRLDAGARLSDDELFGSETTLRAAVQHQWSARWAAWAGYSQGFRVPSLGELFFPFFGNPDLEPEDSDSLEVGARLTGGDWSLEFAVFDSDFDNLIDSDPTSFLAANIGAAESRGLEGSWVWRGPVYRARASLAVTDAETDAGAALLRRPDESAALSLTRVGHHWTVDGFARWVGERPDLDPVTLARLENEGYLTLDLAVARRLAVGGSLRLRVENAFDREYQQVFGFDSPSRRWVVGWSWERR